VARLGRFAARVSGLALGLALTVRDVRIWLNELRETCQCCAQGKDARRPEATQRCCARGTQHCCKKISSDRTIRDAWIVLCSALTNAVTEELIPKNVAGMLHLSKPAPPPGQAVDSRRGTPVSGIRQEKTVIRCTRRTY
jgi:hypothetical protein